MTHMMRACSVLIVAALGLVVAAAAPAFAQNAPQCVVSGSPPAGWGFTSRHDAFNREAYVPGVRLALEKLPSLPPGLTVGLEELLG